LPIAGIAPAQVNSSCVPTLARGRFIEIVEFLVVLQVLQKYHDFRLLVCLHKKSAFEQILTLRVSPHNCANVTLNSQFVRRGALPER
jgi:hypothetical protein